MPQPHISETNVTGDVSPFPALCRCCRKMAAYAVESTAADPAKAVVTIQCRACGSRWALGKIVRAKVS